jgi:type I restriction enzyme R subunit
MFFDLEKEQGIKLDFDIIDKVIENIITVSLRRFK